MSDTTSRRSRSIVTNEIVFDGNIHLTCSSSANKRLILPSYNGRPDQFLAIINQDGNSKMKWVDPPNIDLIRLNQTIFVDGIQSKNIVNFNYQAHHDDVHPIASIICSGDMERFINYYFTTITFSKITMILNFRANIINTKFNHVNGLCRNMKYCKLFINHTRRLWCVN